MVVKAVLLHPEEGVEGVRESGVAVRAAASLGQPARSYEATAREGLRHRKQSNARSSRKCSMPRVQEGSGRITRQDARRTGNREDVRVTEKTNKRRNPEHEDRLTHASFRCRFACP